LRRRDVKREDFNPLFFALFDQMLFWHKKALATRLASRKINDKKSSPQGNQPQKLLLSS